MPAQHVLSSQFTQQYESLRDILQRSLSLAGKCSDAGVLSKAVKCGA